MVAGIDAVVRVVRNVVFGDGCSALGDGVTADGASTRFEGTITAKLVQLDANYNPTSVINDFSASFDFSMELGSAAVQPESRLPESGEMPNEEPETEKPKSENPKDESPYPLPDLYANPYPPTAPSKLITPANAKKI